jgi:hypothetical protein
MAIHELGTARMGNDSKKSVLNSFGQTHDVKNLFVMGRGELCVVGLPEPYAQHDGDYRAGLREPD